jgi:hypothetical protein
MSFSESEEASIVARVFQEMYIQFPLLCPRYKSILEDLAIGMTTQDLTKSETKSCSLHTIELEIFKLLAKFKIPALCNKDVLNIRIAILIKGYKLYKSEISQADRASENVVAANVRRSLPVGKHGTPGSDLDGCRYMDKRTSIRCRKPVVGNRAYCDKNL